ncbi:GAL4 [Geosmithia morbida]|uniref:GAL4 n=1 Tax=Geosmithia morbida TaxID=1094350 RepID=A0A9P4YLU2_9HYPO|nr:GAL4 [Geosmithia morbida]KAF4119348.1 GAL4 [Geosmithia morbida]
MAPSNASLESATTARRQSCDRCHGQKLRCTRSGNCDTGACNRCLRQDAQCVYSFSLPRGRPSRYRTSEQPVSPRKQRTSSSSTTAPIPAYAPITATSDRSKTSTSISTDTNMGLVGRAYKTAEDSLSSSSSSATSDWPWTADMSMDGFPMSMSEPRNGLHAPMAIDPQLESGAFDASIFCDAFPPSWINSRDSFSGVGDKPEGISIDRGHESSSSTGSIGLVRAGRSKSDKVIRARLASPGEIDLSCLEKSLSPSQLDRSTPSSCIAQLSELSMRLHPLLSASCVLAEPTAGTESMGSHDGRCSLGGLMLNDTAFESVSLWVAHVSAKGLSMEYGQHDHVLEDGLVPRLGDVVRDAFAASHQLLYILQSLHLTKPGSTPPVSAKGYFEMPSIPRSSAAASMMASLRGPDQYSAVVARPLVSACHGLLLSTYVVVLIVLQHDADLLLSKSPNSGSDPTSAADMDCPAAASPFGDIRRLSIGI